MGFQIVQKLRQFVQIHAAEFPNIAAAESELQAGGFQPGTLTGRARHLVHERLGPPAQRDGLGLFRGTDNRSHQSFEGHSSAAHPASVLKLDVAVGAVKDLAHDFLWNVAHGGRQWQVVRGQNGFHDAGREVVFEFPQGRDAPFFDTHSWIWHQGFGIDLGHFAQAVAGGARAVRTVEAEQVGLRFRIGEPGGRAHEVP